MLGYSGAWLKKTFAVLATASLFFHDNLRIPGGFLPRRNNMQDDPVVYRLDKGKIGGWAGYLVKIRAGSMSLAAGRYEP